MRIEAGLWISKFKKLIRINNCIIFYGFVNVHYFYCSALITSEEERLRISKSLIDLQIENNRVREDFAEKNFDDVSL